MKLLSILEKTRYVLGEYAMQRPGLSWSILGVAIFGSFLFGLFVASAIERSGNMAQTHINKRNGTIGLRHRIYSWGPDHLRLYEPPECDFEGVRLDGKPADLLKTRPTTALMIGYEIVRASFTQGNEQTAPTPHENLPAPKKQSDLPTIFPPVFKVKTPEQPPAIQAAAAKPENRNTP